MSKCSKFFTSDKARDDKVGSDAVPRADTAETIQPNGRWATIAANTIVVLKYVWYLHLIAFCVCFGMALFGQLLYRFVPAVTRGWS